jgi:NAD(P)-dependent dehydrogenase (short-subunit alcohol dehydrogenase family)
MSSPVVPITGALTGIGRATALAFANEGARVVISGRREEGGKKDGILNARKSDAKESRI